MKNEETVKLVTPKIKIKVGNPKLFTLNKLTLKFGNSQVKNKEIFDKAKIFNYPRDKSP